MKVILKIFGWISIIAVAIIGYNIGVETAEHYSDFNFGYAFAVWIAGFTGSMMPFVAARHLKNQEEIIRLLGGTDSNQDQEQEQNK